MPQKYIPPELGAQSFSCPQCGAQAHQDWFRLYVNTWGDGAPWYPDPKLLDDLRGNVDLADRAGIVKHFERILAREVFFEEEVATSYSTTQLANIILSRCFSCKAFAIWHANELLYPTNRYLIEPNPDMPADVRSDFNEASAIVNSSSRGAAALLRLAIQKLMVHLKQDGKDLNENIGNLVAAGLDQKVQRALDLVRVIGNNAVHPGVIDLKDDKATAIKLFGLVNIIIETTITREKHINELFETAIPDAAKAQIEKRDAKLVNPPKNK
jgi:hypothetical protein